MISTIVSDYSWYYPAACVVIAAALAAVSYYRNKKFAEFPPSKVWMLAAFRFLAVMLMALLLMDIFIRRSTQRTEKPVLAIAIDNSESMLMRGSQAADSMRGFKSALSAITDQLSSKYNVRVFGFGDGCGLRDIQSLDFKDKYTDFSAMLESMHSTLYNTNTGALVICSDGIINRGQNPVYAATSLGKKIYTVTLGDTTSYKDLAVTKCVYNETAFIGNEFPIEVSVNARMLKGRTAVCEIRHGGRSIFRENVSVLSDDFTHQLSTTIKASEKGLQKYTIAIAPVDGEITTTNNTREILVDVVDDKHKVLILSAMPHPDVAAVRNALAYNRGMDVEVVSDLATFDKTLSAYNLVILVQVPSLGIPADRILKEIKSKNIPTLHILGSKTDFNSFNELAQCLTVAIKGNNFEEAGYTGNLRFSLFSTENGTDEFLSKVPPLYCAFGDYKTLSQTHILGNQVIKGIHTDKPLIAISDPSKSRSAVIAGEGIWRWRVDCYRRYQNHEKFDLLISRLCQFLLTRADRERFTVSTRRIFNENEPVYFNAKVLDEMLEPATDATVSLDLADSTGKTTTYKFDALGAVHYLRIDNLTPGQYTYKATANIAGKTFTKSGIVSVMEIKTEAENLAANRNLMARLASTTGGGAYLASDLSALQDALINDTSIRPVVYDDTTTTPLMGYGLLFFIIIALLAAEWFLRKYWGAI